MKRTITEHEFIDGFTGSYANSLAMKEKKHSMNTLHN